MPLGRNYPQVGLIAVTVAVLAGIAFTYFSERQLLRDREIKSLQIQAVELTDAFRRSLRVTTANMTSVAAYFEASDSVAEPEFHTFIDASGFFSEGRHIRAIAIMPVLRNQDIASFNEAMAARTSVRLGLGYPEWSGVADTEAPLTIPATYVESPAGRSGVVGFNLAQSQERMEAARSARETGSIVMTRPVALSQDDVASSQSVLLVAYTPHGRLGLRANLTERARPTFIGVGYTPGFHIADTFKDNPSDLSVMVEDVTDEGTSIPIFDGVELEETTAVASSKITFAGRDWRLNFFAPSERLMATPDWLHLFLVISITLTFAVAFSALRLINSEATLASRVRERTAQLADQNVRLQNAQTVTQEALVKAQQVNKMKSEFLATMSHEFRTPLNAIIGFTDFLINYRSDANREKTGEYLQDIKTSGYHMLELVNEILDAASLEVGKRELSLEEFDISSELQEAMNSLRSLSNQKKITLIMKKPETAVDVRLDRTAIRQIFLNLLSNAIKFSPQSSVVEANIHAEPGQVQIEFLDNGPGIPSNALEKITLPFTRAENDPMLTKEGTGLGLSVVKGLVDLHGGELTIQNRDGGGALVRVTLPSTL